MRCPRRPPPRLVPAALAETFSPSFEVKETKDSYVFKADVPGVKESDIEGTVTGNRLSISGKREVEHKEQTNTFYTYERSYGDFTRSFLLCRRESTPRAWAPT